MPTPGSRRAVAALLVAAGIGAAALPATAAAAPQRPAAHGLLDDLLASLPAPIPALPIPGLTSLLEQATADGAVLPVIVSQITPAQITGLLGDAPALGAVLDGLSSTVTSLLAGQPSAGQVDAVVAQLSALLAGGLPTDPAQIGDLQQLLDGLPQLLTTPGLDTGGLAQLQSVIAGLLGVDPGTLPGAGTGGTGGTLPGGLGGTPTSGSSGLAASLAALLGMGPGTTGTAKTPAKTPAAGSSAPAAAGGQGAASTAYRARVSHVRVARGNRVVRVRVTCPKRAPACVVGLTVKAKGVTGKPQFAGLRGGDFETLRLRVPAAAVKRLGKRGGKLRVTAATLGSSLEPVSRRARAKRR